MGGRGRGEHKGGDKDELKKSGERHRRRGKNPNNINGTQKGV